MRNSLVKRVHEREAHIGIETIDTQISNDEIFSTALPEERAVHLFAHNTYIIESLVSRHYSGVYIYPTVSAVCADYECNAQRLFCGHFVFTTNEMHCDSIGILFQRHQFGG